MLWAWLIRLVGGVGGGGRGYGWGRGFEASGRGRGGEGGVALTRPRPLPLQAMEEGGDVSDVVWELLESGREVGGGVT